MLQTYVFCVYRTENETRNLPVKNQLNQTTLSAPKLNRKLSQFPHKEAQSVTQQSEVWSPSSDMESGWACFVLLKGRLSVLGKAAHSPCWSSTFTPHFAELQSGLPYVGHSFPWPNNQAEQSEVQWRTQPRPWPLMHQLVTQLVSRHFWTSISQKLLKPVSWNLEFSIILA